MEGGIKTGGGGIQIRVLVVMRELVDGIYILTAPALLLPRGIYYSKMNSVLLNYPIYAFVCLNYINRG